MFGVGRKSNSGILRGFGTPQGAQVFFEPTLATKKKLPLVEAL